MDIDRLLRAAVTVTVIAVVIIGAVLLLWSW